MARYLYHYTTLSALMEMLHIATKEEKYIMEHNNDESGYGYYLMFHATDVRMMNDKLEQRLVLDIVDKKIKSGFKQIYRQENATVGNAFVISFCEDRDYLPMWQIYAQNKNGVCLKFDLSDENVNFIEKLNNITEGDFSLGKCEYLTQSQLNNRVTEMLRQADERYKETPPGQISSKYPYLEINKKASFFKGEEWSYEKEWRLVLWHNFCEVKHGRYGVCPYRQINIPLRFLKEILIGPNDNQNLVQYGIETWMKTNCIYHLQKYGVDIKISQSKSSLRTM